MHMVDLSNKNIIQNDTLDVLVNFILVHQFTFIGCFYHHWTRLAKALIFHFMS